MEENLRIDELIEMGGHLELTCPLMLFLEDDDLEQHPDDEHPNEKMYAIIAIAQESKIQVLSRKLNAIYGVITEAKDPVQLTNFESCAVEPVSDKAVNGHKFVTTWADLEFAIQEHKRGQKE